MTMNRPPRTRTAYGLGGSALARSFLALSLLTALLIGPPIALLAFVGNPIPDQAVVGDRLTDDAVIGMLAAVVWIAWVQFAVAVFVEGAAAVRSGPLPRRIPLSAPQQQLARHLVVAVSFLLAGGSALSTSPATAAPAASATAPCTPQASATSDQQIDSGPAEPQPGPSAQPEARDGATATTSDLPAQRSKRHGSKGPHGPDAASGRWYVVQPPRGANHDTLWDIAERHLGDGLRWREIYELNRGRPQPDGRELHLPRLIHPGWRLLLPADATGLPEPDPDGQAPSRLPIAVPAPAEQTGPGHDHHVEREKVGDLAAADSVSAPGTTEPETTRFDDTDRDDSDPQRVDTTTDPDDEPSAPLDILTLGLSAIACAGLTAELARRRRRAQRFRQPGERLRAPTGPATAVEGQLRYANAETAVAELLHSLRLLAATGHQTGHELPDVQVIRLNPTRATLHLAADAADPPAPFTVVDQRTWTVDLQGRPRDIDEVERRTAIEDPVDPYPALVALGVGEEEIVLINLESAGTLRILGPAEESGAILHAIAAELGTSSLSQPTEILLTGCPRALEKILDAGRARALPPASARRWMAARQRDVGSLLGEAGVADLLAARTRQIAADTWAPGIFIEGHVGAEGPENERSIDLSVRPYGGACLVTTRPPVDGEAPGWTLVPKNDAWRLEPLGIELAPQRLRPDRMNVTAELLAVAVDPAVSRALPDVSDEPSTPSHQAVPPARMQITSVTLPGHSQASPTDLSIIASAIPEPVVAHSPTDPCEDDSTPGPRVLVLGPVEILDAKEEAPPRRRRRAAELITYLALHPNATQHQLDEALWPGIRVSRGTRNPLVSRARQWLGTAPDGHPYVALVGEDSRYSLHPDVTCDWDDFRSLARRGLAGGAVGKADLVAALELVRGRPFLGVNPAAYTWAEPDIQDMISAIVDVSQTLAGLAFASGDFHLVRWSTAHGLAAEPFAEGLHLAAARAASAMGNHDEAERIIRSFRNLVQDLDPDDDIDEATAGKLMTM